MTIKLTDLNFGDNGSTPADLVEPHRKYWWELVNASSASDRVFEEDIDGFNIFAWQVHTVDLPLPKFTPVDVFAGGKRTMFAGTQDIDQFSIVFNEGYSANVLTFFTYWQNMIRNRETGLYGLPYKPTNGEGQGYKQDLAFALHNGHEQDLTYNWVVMLKGIWPISVANLGLDDTAEATQIQVEFSMDDLVISALQSL